MFYYQSFLTLFLFAPSLFVHCPLSLHGEYLLNYPNTTAIQPRALGIVLVSWPARAGLALLIAIHYSFILVFTD